MTGMIIIFICSTTHTRFIYLIGYIMKLFKFRKNIQFLLFFPLWYLQYKEYTHLKPANTLVTITITANMFFIVPTSFIDNLDTRNPQVYPYMHYSIMSLWLIPYTPRSIWEVHHSNHTCPVQSLLYIHIRMYVCIHACMYALCVSVCESETVRPGVSPNP